MADPELTVERPIGRSLAWIKPALWPLAELFAAPFTLLFHLGRLFVRDREDELFQGFSQAVSLLPGFMGINIRNAFYRRTLRRCSRRCYIGFGTLFATRNVEIAHNVYIGPRSMIGHARLEQDVLIGSNVDILGGRHQHGLDRLDIPIRLQGGHYTIVTVGRDAWIGNGAIVTDDVGEQAVVAAGAVVVKPVPPRAVVGGNPARVIAERGDAAGVEANQPVGP